MLEITNAAFTKLHEMLSTEPVEIAARISRKDNRTRVCRGKRRSGDAVVEHDGRIVLLMNKSISDRLQNKVLDVRKTAGGLKLGIRLDRKDPPVN